MPASTRAPLSSAEAGRSIAVKYTPNPTARHTIPAARNEHNTMTTVLFAHIIYAPCLLG